MAQRHSSPVDHVRQIVVTLGCLAMCAGMLKGTGSTQQWQWIHRLPGMAAVDPARGLNGWLGASMTLVAPDARSFWIWLPIVVGLIAYTYWQWRSGTADDDRYRDSGWFLALAMAGIGGWFWVVEANQAWWSTAVLAGIAFFTFLGVRGMSGASSARTLATTLMADAGPQLLLGWACVATLANAAAAMGAQGTPLTGLMGQFLVVGAFLVLVVLSGVFVRTLGPRLLLAFAMAWGLGWIAWNRIVGHPRSQIVGWGAAASAIMVLFLTIGSLISLRD